MREQVDLTEETLEGTKTDGEDQPFEFSLMDTLARLDREWTTMSDALIMHEKTTEEFLATGEEAVAQVGMSPMPDTPLSLTPKEAEADTDEEINITPPLQPLKTVFDLGTNKPAPSEDLVTDDEEEAEHVNQNARESMPTKRYPNERTRITHKPTIAVWRVKGKQLTKGGLYRREGEKGGGMFTALVGDEVDISAIKETTTMIWSGELSDAVQLDEDDDEDEKFKGQFRFLKLTGRKFSNIAKKEVKQVKTVVASAITKAGGNPT
ncbi:hypothetical protein CYMTET_2934 [Cymbomonas tetramitiformis]|uniref:Uncharacterized protein n=1 Tax=Cymbomonas tetramitiformis TaxID=36881 RepID=A0AAE0H4E1_9CHLO|nr:hypothetical protein CYMTET_2934 [Cymbomonas tetramitiformis]